MILIINKTDANSRAFYAKYRNNFDEILAYPACLDRFPQLAKFPAVVIDAPEIIVDNSLWFAVKKLGNYKRLGMVVKDFQEINRRLGCGQGIPFLDTFIAEKRIDGESKKFLIEVCNDFEIPAPFAAWGIPYCYDLGEDCKDDLDEQNKTRSILTGGDMLEIIKEHEEIIYPETMGDILKENQKWIDKIARRDGIYKGK